MSEAIVEIARAKVNLALHVLGRRADGYHELDSIVAFADYGDRLMLQVSDQTQLTVTGSFAGDVPTSADNLVLRAYALFGAHIDCPPVAFSLEKNLPVASGIGGGSADAAAALRGLLRLTGRSVAPVLINDFALQLGADVPVCLNSKAVRMQGVGETLTPLAKAPDGAVVLVNPLLPCGTAAVFKTLGLANGQSFRSALDPADQSCWRNDLSDAAIAVVPEIARVLSIMKAKPELNVVRMSGSGATCFGLTSDTTIAASIAAQLQRQHPDWWIVSAALC
jgi:4-diphosphocytidyl-2-C-methyl-D-erythritol kinase